MNRTPELLVVGAGFFGLTIAENFARVLKKPVLVLDKRDHIGGNAYSEIESKTGIEVHKYGSHLFHTSNERVWTYINQFSKFNDYVHRVFTVHKGQAYSMPINLHTISQLAGKSFSPVEAKQYVMQQTSTVPKETDQDSFEDRALREIGPELYNAFIRGYTLKQWQTDPKELPGEVFSRLPVRFDFNNRYFSDKYEGLPIDGYFKIFERMVENPLIRVELGKDYFQSEWIEDRPPLTIYTGPIDRYFDYKNGPLSWRTLDFQFEVRDEVDFQGTSVMNYADEEVKFTRIHEFKHLHPERLRETSGTVIAREYSRFAGRDDEPYYPVNSPRDRETLLLYRQEIAREKDVLFGGRLGRYQYLDMHMAIGAALNMFETEVLPRFLSSQSG